ncbi:MAG: amidohydrolase family protein [Pseudomonadales bacterium]|nr:amidohydrolase family protein [Pseudomonadales bacterium]
MSTFTPGSDEWLALVNEPIIDPQRPIIDPHHHLWRNRFQRDYMLEDLWADTGSGHNIVKTVFVECHAFYRKEAAAAMQPLGETECIAALARASQGKGKAEISGIVAHADLTLGKNPDTLQAVLDAHRQLAGPLFKGIRHAGARDKNPEQLLIPGRAPSYLYGREDFRAGLRLLGSQGLVYDTWHYHHQNEDFLELAQAVPETTMVLDHFGTPLGVGNYRGAGDAIFTRWREDIAQLAKCPNVYAKLGGLAMPDNGFGWDKATAPPGSDEFVQRQKRYYLHTLECFGPERCMFESNFPVDKLSLPYHVVWNGFKKMVADFSESEKQALFYGTAARVYGL